MIHVSDGYPQTETTSAGTNWVIQYYSYEPSELQAVIQSHPIGMLSVHGTVSSTKLTPDNGVWRLEVKCITSDSSDSIPEQPTVVKPSLDASMLSLPLESHKLYRTYWNHYLAIAPLFNADGSLSTTVTALPDWAKTATDTVLTQDDAQKYSWIKSPGECPVTGKYRWRIAMAPPAEFRGVETYDVAVYTMKETRYYKSFKAACQAVGGRANKIVQPFTNLSAKGNWKCDSASVSWDGHRWVGSYSYTLSGNSKGWNSTLYSEA